MEFEKVIFERYSCKSYADKQVEDEKLEAILLAGKVAPTAKNLQPAKVYVLKSAEALATFDGICGCRYRAPMVLMITALKNECYTYPGGKRTSGIEDATIIATHMILEATNQGLNTCWLNAFDPDLMAEAFNIPEEEEILMCMDLGYKDEKGVVLPKHTIRKDLPVKTL